MTEDRVCYQCGGFGCHHCGVTQRKHVATPETTKVCPSCGNTEKANGEGFVRIGTQNIKMCANCPTNLDWRRKPGEPDIYGGVVEGRK